MPRKKLHFLQQPLEPSPQKHAKEYKSTSLSTQKGICPQRHATNKFALFAAAVDLSPQEDAKKYTSTSKTCQGVLLGETISIEKSEGERLVQTVVQRGARGAVVQQHNEIRLLSLSSGMIKKISRKRNHPLHRARPHCQSELWLLADLGTQ